MVSLVVLGAAGVVTGLVRGSAVPRGIGRPVSRRSWSSRRPGSRSPGSSSRPVPHRALQSLQAYDAWAFWVPKGKAIFFFHGLDEHVFTTHPERPVPALAADPRRRGLPRDGRRGRGHPARPVLVPRRRRRRRGRRAAPSSRPAWLLWPSLLLVLVVPRFHERLLAPQADILVDVLVVVAALLLALWLRDRAGWRLAAAAVLLAGAVNTKREGILFAACRAGRRVRRLPASVLAAARGRVSRGRAGHPPVAHLGRTARHPAGTPSSFDGSTGSADAVQLSFEVLYSTALWSVVPLVATIALAAAAVWGDRRLAAYIGLLALLLFAGGVWSTVGFEELTITADKSGNPIVRYTGAIVLLAAVATPAASRPPSGEGGEGTVTPDRSASRRQ